MKSNYLKKIKLPQKSGVYFFYKSKELLYIGKATSLRDRVKSYFGKELINTRGPLLLDMVTQATSIKWQETESVLEALILEANLIKKYLPRYNTKEKDNKSFNYVCITKDTMPKVLTIRGRGLDKKIYDKVYGPFPNGLQLREAMKIIRRIFPYIDEQSSKKNNIVFYSQLGLVPDINIVTQKHKNFSRFTQRGEPYTDKNFYVSASHAYKKSIKNLKLFFEGKKKRIISNLKKEMQSYAKKKEFEKAGAVKKQIFALEHINDIALIKEDTISPKYISGSNRLSLTNSSDTEAKFRIDPVGDFDDAHPKRALHLVKTHYRVEAYDIAHLGGSNMVGVMTVIEDGELAKSEYKKFIIRSQESSNDTGALEEVLSRRLRHTEWGLPNLIVMDGSTAQINIAKMVLSRYQFKIPVVSVVKDDKHKAKAIMGDEDLIKKYKKQILLINSESHRFAITFHKKRRDKNFLK